MNTDQTLKIYFVDGNTLTFKFPAVTDVLVGEAVTSLMNQANVVIEAEGRLFVLPTSNIKYLDVHPAPERLGTKIVRGAKLVE